MPVDIENLKTVSEAAGMLGIKPSDVYNLIYQKELESRKIGAARMVELGSIESLRRRREAEKEVNSPCSTSS